MLRWKVKELVDLRAVCGGLVTEWIWMGDDCENVRAAGSVDGSWERGGEAIYSRRDTAAGGCKRFDRFASKLGDRFALYIVGVRPGQAGPGPDSGVVQPRLRVL